MIQLPSRLDEVAAALQGMSAGPALLVCSAGQQSYVASALAGYLQVPPPTDRTEQSPPVRPNALQLYSGLPDLPTLSLLNGRRDLHQQLGCRLVFVLDLREVQIFQRHAGDLWAQLRVNRLLSFFPQRVEEEAALAQFRLHLRTRYGKLDLRGFARSEREDVSWDTLSVWVELHAASEGGHWSPLWEVVTPDFGIFGKPVVILGHPGSGKTFFLRWLSLHQLSATADQKRRFDVPLGAGVVPIPLSLPALLDDIRTFGLFGACREALLREGMDIAHLMEHLAERKKIAFLLDGLDEVGEADVRMQVAREVAELADRLPGCQVIVTSRITGFNETPISGEISYILPLDAAGIKRFLIRWCTLYATEQHGPEAAWRGQAEGERLAEDVVRHPQLRTLAGLPLMLTVLAMVHRAGLRMPDHRVELYEHIIRILVERWNRLRGGPGPDQGPPIPLADAVRLLGPVALDLIRQGSTSAIGESRLRDVLSRALTTVRLRQRLDLDAALSLFRNQLGLLVEQGPGQWGFLHLTLAEHLAALELVRSSGHEVLARNPAMAFNPRFREVMLLAAGLLGIVRADDDRLSTFVRTLHASAAHAAGDEALNASSLLAGLLADDAGIASEDAQAIVYMLVPRWWFGTTAGGVLPAALAQEATSTLGPRILEGRHGSLLRAALAQIYTGSVHLDHAESLARAGATLLAPVVYFLEQSGILAHDLLGAVLDLGDAGKRAVLETVEGEGSWTRLGGYLDFPAGIAHRILSQVVPTTVTLTLRVRPFSQLRMFPVPAPSLRVRTITCELPFEIQGAVDSRFRIRIKPDFLGVRIVRGPISGRFTWPAPT